MEYSCATCVYSGAGWHEAECGAMRQCICGSEYKDESKRESEENGD